jgi:hypothetical protein
MKSTTHAQPNKESLRLEAAHRRRLQHEKNKRNFSRGISEFIAFILTKGKTDARGKTKNV